MGEGKGGEGGVREFVYNPKSSSGMLSPKFCTFNPLGTSFLLFVLLPPSTASTAGSELKPTFSFPSKSCSRATDFPLDLTLLSFGLFRETESPSFPEKEEGPSSTSILGISS